MNRRTNACDRRQASRSTYSLLEGLETRRLMAWDPDLDPVYPDDNEPNNTFAQATEFGGIGSGGGGTIHKNGSRSDIDYWRFTANQTTAVSIKMYFAHISGDLNLTLYDGNQNQIASSNSSNNNRNYERITAGVQAGQTYFIKVTGNINPEYSFTVSPLTANFNWSMQNRFGAVDQYGLPIAPNTRDYVMPNPTYINGVETPRFPVNFDVPGGITGDVTYNYDITGQHYSVNQNVAGASAIIDLPNGTYTVRLTATADGTSISTTQNITVRNYLIAAIGDSYGSGEGNPHAVAQYDWLGYATRGAVWAQGSNAQESLYHRMAHRSTKAGVAQMALELENSDPKSSVTFVFLNHTGSTITEGVLGWRETGDPAVPGQMPPQVDRLQELTTGRKIDSLFVSIGGNDLGFADILADLVKNDPLNPIWNYEDRIDEIIDRSLANLEELKNVRYPNLAQRLSSFDIGQVFLTEYPDLTKQSDGQVANAILDDILVGSEVDRHELTRLIEGVMPGFVSAMKTASAKFGWNYVDGIMQAFSHHGYGDWFRKASDSIVMQGPLNHQWVITPLDIEKTKGTMHPINGGLTAQRDAMLNDLFKANLVTSAFSIGGNPQWNDNATYSITITNNSFLVGAGASTAAIYLSGDTSVDTNDTRLLLINVPALAPGQSITLTGTLPQMADSYRAAGNHVYVAPVLDINFNVAESDEVDNRVYTVEKMGVIQSEMDLQPNGSGGWMMAPRSINLGGSLSGRLGIDEIVGRGDMDYYAFNATAGQTIDVDIDVAGYLDTYIRIYETMYNVPIGPAIAANDNAFAPGETLNTGDSYVRFTIPYTGRYVIVVSHVANANANPLTVTGRTDGGTGDYAINVKAANVTPPVAQSFNYDLEAGNVKAIFSQDVGGSLTSSALQLVNTTTGFTIPTSWYRAVWNAATQSATFHFDVTLPNGNYRATIVGGQVRNGDGTTMVTSPSTTFHVLAGDVNNDRVVNFSDLLILAQNYGNSGRLFSQGNVNRSIDGKVDFSDLLILAQQYGQSLPASVNAVSMTATKSRGESRFSDLLI